MTTLLLTVGLAVLSAMMLLYKERRCGREHAAAM